VILDFIVGVLKIIPTALFIVGGFIDQPISYLGGLGHRGGEVAEPIHILSGPRYASIKIDLPFTEESLWYYAGDEPKRNGLLDEDTYTFRISDFGDTYGLDGHESSEDFFQSTPYDCGYSLANGTR
tara:strand:+ start:2600 stop:2977 length:378 start_codon:yes stop_codon:yes gene_type:complete